ncbi:MAG: hypothetical protein IT425_10950, partial [Pirellulales bacterium]|nr:hypothetical protein [Pirellulales bacterium]
LIDCDTPDARPAVVMDDVRSADITALRAGSKGGERLVLRTSALILDRDAAFAQPLPSNKE